MKEAIDSIRTILLRSMGPVPYRVVMVTSAEAGEAKTTFASQLATSVAATGRKTLLVDCDFRRPSVHQMFDVPVEPGMSECLRGEADLGAAVRPTAVPGLAVLPSGRVDHEALHALGQDRGRALFERLRADYDFIVVDCCPVLPAADALVIGQFV